MPLPERILLPIEVLGADGTTVSRTVTLPAGTGWAGTISLAAGPRSAVCGSSQRPSQHQRLDTPQQQYGHNRRAGPELRWNRRRLFHAGHDSSLARRHGRRRATTQSASGSTRPTAFVSTYRVLAWNFRNSRGEEGPPARQFCGGCARQLDTTLARRSVYPGGEGALAERFTGGKQPAQQSENSGALCRLPCAGWARPEILQLLQRQHCCPRPLPWPVHTAERADRQLHSKSCHCLILAALEPSRTSLAPDLTSNRSRTGRRAPDSRGSSIRTRTHCRIWFASTATG